MPKLLIPILDEQTAWCSSCHPGCKACCQDNISGNIRRPDRADIIEMIRKRDMMKLAA